MKILFAPDYREGNPYQSCLAEHLDDVTFLSGYRRILPLARGTRHVRPDILHLHWPEAYFRNSRTRQIRYPIDLRLACLGRKLVVTAHNLFPHEGSDEHLVRRNVHLTFQSADAVIAHSESAKTMVASAFAVEPDRIHVIPHGNLSKAIPALLSKEEALARLGLPANEKICLMFGRVADYKGIEEVVDAWPETSTRLAIVGDCPDQVLAGRLRSKLQNGLLHLERCSDAELSLWLSTASVTIFNYRTILTSGSACLARSLGIPILIPSSLDSIDLDEPSPGVFRFDSLDLDFTEKLEAAIRVPRQQEGATEWQAATSWSHVARLHHDIYASL